MTHAFHLAFVFCLLAACGAPVNTTDAGTTDAGPVRRRACSTPGSLTRAHRSMADAGSAGQTSIEARKTYDTAAPGLSNSGHLMGDSLTSPERRAVLEYLKTL